MSERPNGIVEELWDFPCDYDLKVMGGAHHPMEEIVVEIVERHVSNFDRRNVRSRMSRTGKYISITASFTFTHKDQVEGVYADLNARSEVAWKL